MKQENSINKIAFYLIFAVFILKNTVLLNINFVNISFALILFIFSAFYLISYKLYNLTKPNLLFMLVFSLFFLQGLIITIINNFSIYSYFYDSLRYLSFIGMFLLGKYAYQNSKPLILFAAFLIIILFHIFSGYYNLIIGNVEYLGAVRLAGAFDNIGQFGLLMGIAILISLFFYRETKNPYLKGFNILLIILLIGLLAFNNTLRIIIALTLSLLFYYIVLKRKYSFLLLAAFFGLIISIINKEVFIRINEILTANYNNLDLLLSQGFENSFQWRIMQWILLLKDWYENYFLFGAGIGQQTMLKGFIAPWGEPFQAHSDLIKIFVETGVVGFSVVLFLCICFIKYLRRISPDFFHNFSFFFLLCFITGNTFFTNPVLIWIFMIGYFSMKTDKVELK